jgi:hypothetical protein
MIRGDPGVHPFLDAVDGALGSARNAHAQLKRGQILNRCSLVSRDEALGSEAEKGFSDSDGPHSSGFLTQSDQPGATKQVPLVGGKLASGELRAESSQRHVQIRCLGSRVVRQVRGHETRRPGTRTRWETLKSAGDVGGFEILDIRSWGFWQHGWVGGRVEFT